MESVNGALEHSKYRLTGRPLFPAEIQAQIFEDIMMPSGARLAVVQVSRQHDAIVPDILNAAHLREADTVREIARVSRLGRATALFYIQRSALHNPWLQRLGLAQYHVHPETDIIFTGVIRGNLPPLNMVGLSLVLGNEFPNIMVNASRFMAFVGSSIVPVDPVAAALTSLVSYGGIFANLFAATAQGLPQPGLPRNLFYFLGNYATSPCANATHNQNGTSSWCLHFNHLEIVPEHAIDQWMYQAQPAVNARTRQLIQNVRRFWNRLRGQTAIAVSMPNIYFARIPTATGLAPADAGASAFQTASAINAESRDGQISGLTHGVGLRPSPHPPQTDQTPREWFYQAYLPNAEQSFVLKYQARDRGLVGDGVVSTHEDASAAGPSDAQLQAFREWVIANVLPLVEEAASKR